LQSSRGELRKTKKAPPEELVGGKGEKGLIRRENAGKISPEWKKKHKLESAV